MKIYHITFSPTGTSRKVSGQIVKEFTGEFGGEEINIDLCEENPEQIQIEQDALCVFSVPCYGGRIPKTAAERLVNIKGASTAAVVCVTFGNRAFEDALLELSDAVTDNGFSVFAGCAVVTEHNIMHVFGTGRPDAVDCEEIQKFAEETAAKFQEHGMNSPEFPGNRPYKEWKGSSLQILVDEETCSNCGLCAAKCPVQAIFPDRKETDATRCINCMRCIEICPKKSRYLAGEVLQGMVERLRTACEERKNNKFYL